VTLASVDPPAPPATRPSFDHERDPHPKKAAGKKAAAPKVRRIRIYTRLSDGLRKRLAEYGAAVGRSERAIIEEAVSQYLAGNRNASSVSTPIDRLAQAIDHDQRRRDVQHRELELLSEAFGQFLKLWTAVHATAFQKPDSPSATEALRQQRAAGEALYKRVASTIAERFINGHRFVHDMPNVEGSPREGAHKTRGHDGRGE
jgi:hypothetical protein